MYKLLHTLLNLAHFLCNVYIAIRYTCIAAYRKCTDLWCATTELDVLLRMRAKTKKVPRHLVIVLGLCDESVLDCVRIIGWCITLNIPYISFFDRNGNRSKINVLLLSDTDGKGKIVSLVQSLTKAICSGNLDPKDITDQLISEKLDMKGMPNPDLALIYGYTCSTHGLLPWHIRTTEFLMLPLYISISVKDFTHLLERYNKFVQRYGK
ncbi:hypothetical protein ACFW04_008487 [Cataglyphis niger]